jgi:hypothetical protein
LFNHLVGLLSRSEIKRRTKLRSRDSNNPRVKLLDHFAGNGETALARLIGRKANHDRCVGHSFLPVQINRQIAIASSTDMHGAEMTKRE